MVIIWFFTGALMAALVIAEHKNKASFRTQWLMIIVCLVGGPPMLIMAIFVAIKREYNK